MRCKRLLMVWLLVASMLTFATVQFSHAALVDDLVGYWGFDEAGNVGLDKGDNGYDGVAQDNAACLAGGVLGGGALALDGAGDYMQLPDMATNFTDSASLSLWVKLNVHTPTDNSMTGFMDFDTGDNSHYTWSDGLMYSGLFRSAGRFDGINSLAGLQRDQWHLLTVVNDPVEGYKIYQNDQEIFSDVQPNFGIADFKIGTQNNYWMNGTVDEVGLWNRALTSTEVAELYNGGSGLDFFSDGTLVSTGTAPSEWHLATCWTGDVPGGIPTNQSHVSVDGHTVTVTTSAAEASKLQIINGGEVIVNASQSLAVGSIDASGGTLTVPSGAMLEAGKMTTTGLSVVSGSIVDILRELDVNSAIDMTGVALDVSSGTVKLSTGGTLTHTGALTVASLATDGGTLDLGGNNLTVTNTLNVIGAFDTTDPNLGAVDLTSARVNLEAGGTLTANTTISADTLAFLGGSMAGAGSIVPTNQYVVKNTAVSRDLGGPAELIVSGDGELSGTNTYAGKTSVSGGGTLTVTDLDQNVGAGYLEMDNAYLSTSGTVTRTIGTGDGQISFPGNFGFEANGGDLTVTLARNDGQDIPLEWNSDVNGFNGRTLMVDKTGDYTVEITNDIDLQGGRTLDFNYNQSPTDVADIKLSGNLTGDRLDVRDHINGWDYGLTWLSGSDLSGLKSVRMWQGGIIRMVDEDTGLGNLTPGIAEVYYGRIETNGTYQFKGLNGWGSLGNTTPGYVVFNNQGGISAYGGDLTFEMSGELEGDPWSLTEGAFYHFFSMSLNSQYSDGVVTVKGDVVNGDGGEKDNWGINIYNNPNSNADYGRLEGNWSMETMYITGINQDISRGGMVKLVEGYTITTDNSLGQSGDFTVRDTAVFRVNGTLDVTNGGNVYVQNSGVLGGKGTVIVPAAKMVEVQGGSGIAPGDSIGTLTINGGGELAMLDGSIYEWEVGQPGDTDVLNIVGGTLDLDNFTLKILDAEGYVLDATDQLPVFTYSGGTTLEINLAAANFDTSMLDGSWDWSAGLSLTDDAAGTIYLTGLVGGSPASLKWDGGAGNWADAMWGGAAPTADQDMVINADTDDSDVTVAADFIIGGTGPAASVFVGEEYAARLTVAGGVTLEVTGETTAGEFGKIAIENGATLQTDSAVIEIDGRLIAGVQGSAGDSGLVDSAGQLTIEDAEAIQVDWMPGSDAGSMFGGTYTVASYTGTALATTGTTANEDANIGAAYIKSVDYAVDLGGGVLGVNVELHAQGLGDTDLDGDVDGDDLATFGLAWAPSGTDKTWFDGDFDFDGDIDGDDLAALGLAWAPSGIDFPAGELQVTAVPEPGTIVMLLIGMAGLLIYRKRR